MATTSSKATWIALRSIFRQGFGTRNDALHHPSISKIFNHNDARRRLSSSGTCRKPSTEPQQQRQQNVKSNTSSIPKRKAASRSPPSNTSLHRVAVEAQRSRGTLIRGKGKARHIDPSAETKEVTAYCAAETYDVHEAQDLLVLKGWKIDPTSTDMFPQVLHAQKPIADAGSAVGDVFIFPSGCVVAWNVPRDVARLLVESILRPAAGGGKVDKVEEESLDFIEDSTQQSSIILGDTIILGTADSSDNLPSDNPANLQADEVDTVLAKIAFSSAIARSTKLAVLEERLAKYFDTTRTIPATLSAGAQLRFTRAFILQKTGELLNLRAQLNLYSELTDALPDLFWDSPHELGLENYYEMVGKALDVGVRIKVLNERMDYASEIAAVLRERLSEKHSTGLEWMIIGLIMIEVGFGCLHLWRENSDRGNRMKTEELLQEYLEKELGTKRTLV